MAARHALITGIAGQDGSLLAEQLLSEGYEVFGVVRRPTSERFENLEAVRDRIELVQADLLDDAYMPPVAAVVDHLRGSAAWALEQPVSFRTAVARKLADEVPEAEWKGEQIGGRMSFRYLPPRRRAVAAVRQRVFSTRIGLRAVELVRPFLGRSGGGAG